jgi:hypothetical protein
MDAASLLKNKLKISILHKTKHLVGWLNISKPSTTLFYRFIANCRQKLIMLAKVDIENRTQSELHH